MDGRDDRPKTLGSASASGQLEMAGLGDHAILVRRSLHVVKLDFGEARKLGAM